MKKLLLIALLSFSAYAQNEMMLGYMPYSTTPTILSLAVTSTTWLALGIVPKQAKQISKVLVWNTAVSGSPSSSDLSCDLYSATGASIPNASIESRSTVTTTPTGAGTVEYTGFTATSALTADTQYFLVFHNSNTAVLTIQFGAQYSSNGYAGGGGQASGTYGWSKVGSINSGAAWTTAPMSMVAGIRIQYSDGTFEGTPDFPDAGAPAVKANSANEVATDFTIGTVPLNVCGLVFYTRRVGTTPGNMQGRVYVDAAAGASTLLATGSVSSGYILTDGIRSWSVRFASVQIPASAKVRVSLSSSAGDTSNYYQVYWGTKLDGTTASLGLEPFGGMAYTTCTGTCTTTANWSADDKTKFIDFGLLLCAGNEFGASSGGTRSASYPIGQ